MARAYVPLLLVLAALWGSSFMFIKVAVEEIAPTTVMAARLGLSAVPLFALLALRTGLVPALTHLRAVWREGLLLGAVNAALPFVLIGWGETRIDSGIAAIANSSVPIFVTALAVKFRPSERVSGGRLLGVLIGLLGVAIVAGVDPEGGWWGVAGALACVAAAFSYAIGALYSQGRLSTASPTMIATATTLWGTVLLLPAGVLQAPSERPSFEALGSVVALAIAGTVVGLLIYFRLIDNHGSMRASLVVYLVPLLAVLYGALLLDEPLRASAVVGLALVLGGVALGSGVVRLRGGKPALAGR